MTFHFSPSQMSLLYECPLCFYREHVEGIKRPRGPFPGLPSAVDHLVQNKTAKFAGKGKPSWLLPWMKEGVIKAGSKRFEAHGEHWQLTGVVDDLILMNDGSVIITDYKTARAAHSLENSRKYYGLQMDCYALLLKANGFLVAKKAYLVYTTPDYIENRVALINTFGIGFKVTPVALGVDAQRAKDAIRKGIEICMQKEAPPASPDCEFCRYRNQC